MRLEAFSVRNYRSIRNAARIQVRSEPTVLIGPNNEGKTNILRSLSLAASTIDNIAIGYETGRLRLKSEKDSPRQYATGLMVRRSGYDWEQDFPMDRQSSQQSGETIIRLSFALTKQERDDFYTQVGHRISESLPIELAFGQNRLSVRIPKKRWGPQLSKAAGKIAMFVRDRMQIEYIPAVRTHEHATRVIDDVLATRLAQAEVDPEYAAALEIVRRAQQPVLDAVSAELTSTLQQFLPAVQSVRVEIPQSRRFERLRTASDVIVDDGVATSLSNKGDGVISLAAIGLMRGATKRTTGGSLLLAIEEPEAHLHPRGMHLLREAIRDLATSHQVIITTHSPLFAERSNTSANVIVEGNGARPAREISEVRKCLGVQVSDNLCSAEVALLVEGRHDLHAIKALLADYSQELEVALEGGRFVVQPLGGCSRLRERIYSLDHLVLSWHCLLDHDDDGRGAFQDVVDLGIATSRQCTFTLLGKKRQSEIEDWYAEDVYRDAITAEFGDLLGRDEYKRNRAKWSVRVRSAMEATGQNWDANESKIKGVVAAQVIANPSTALKPAAETVFEAMAEKLESSLAR